jgi:hypothetical protein
LAGDELRSVPCANILGPCGCLVDSSRSLTTDIHILLLIDSRGCASRRCCYCTIASETAASLALCVADCRTGTDTAAVEPSATSTTAICVAQAGTGDELKTLTVADVAITSGIRRELWARKSMGDGRN